ncbi:DUF4227 family protein [Paenibacillus sp. MMS20-IR301]|uniref:DUF4227 family protein n=1 Tax=Paenibacillus sp. MMS20-IR301 TaxID=2895946 RepID=UPI0028EC1553|nr:DUF4227 family protein [Paenibacillus sp. MMS20-IR301]WNS44388.1 DUF4227 family protein [Paenibacillus sp. MMS20-IR301]
MIVSLPKTVRRLYFMALLVTLSCVLYYVMSWVSVWISPAQQEDIPEGTAVRAFYDAGGTDEGLSAGQRLRLYYWYGE